MPIRIRNALLVAAMAAYWAVLIHSSIGVLQNSEMSWSALAKPISQLLPWLGLISLMYGLWRGWTAIKKWVRRRLSA